MLTFGKDSDKTFSITIVTRGTDGSKTNATRTFSHDNPYKIWEYWNRHKGKSSSSKKRGKKKQSKADQVPTSQEADKLLREAAQYAETKQKGRDTDVNKTEN
jgi:hypothetical protein